VHTCAILEGKAAFVGLPGITHLPMCDMTVATNLRLGDQVSGR